MLEIKLLAIFTLCAAFLTVSGIIIVRYAEKNSGNARIFIMLPVSKSTSDIEFLVRNCIYKAAEQYPETAVILCNYGADEETIYIFERLMRDFGKYYVADAENSAENICKIINSMV